MPLAGGDEVHQIKCEVFDVRIGLVAHVRVGFRQRGSRVGIATVCGNRRIHCAHNLVSIVGDDLCCSKHLIITIGASREKLLHIWCIWQPSNVMHMWATTVLPLEPVPVVSDSQNIHVEGINVFRYAVVKEPVGNSWIFCHCCSATRSIVGRIWAEESSQLRPLAICSTVCEEHSGQSQHVHQGYQPAPLLEPIPSSSTQAGGIVEHSIAERLTVMTNHVPRLRRESRG